MEKKSKKLTIALASALAVILIAGGVVLGVYFGLSSSSSEVVENTSSSTSSPDEETTPLHVHSLSHVEATEATCEEEGNTEYWYCSECFNYYSDQGAVNEISREDTVIEAIGHDWDVSWKWSSDCSMCMATFTCMNDSEHVKQKVASVTLETKEATCEEEGVHTYTASVEFEGNTYTDVKTETIEATGVHTYGDDGYCIHCGVHKPTEGLTYSYDSETESYTLTGIGTATDADIYIPDTYDDGINGQHPVTSIGDSAFYEYNSLKSVSIPVSVTYIGEFAFFTWDTSEDYINVYYDGTASQWASISFADMTSSPMCSGGYLYLNGVLCEDITIDGISVINDYAFWGCFSLKSVTVSGSVTSIGYSAFYHTPLESVTLNEGLESIVDGAFSFCRQLTEITVPDSVTYLGDAFNDCTSLETVILGKGITRIPATTFMYCSSLKNVTILGDVTFIGTHAFNGCSALESIVIPGTVTTIQLYAFECSSLTYIYYGGSEYTVDYSFPYGTVYCYSEEEPTTEGNFWHYIDGVPTVW